MQVLSRATDNSLVTPQASPQHVRPPGQYYSHLDGAWVVRHKQSDPSRAGSYPSPPMSGSPHSQKAASDASERPPPSNSYPTALPQDVYRTAASSTQPSPTDSQPSQGFPSAYDYHHRPYAPETTQPRDAMAPAQHATARYPPRPLSFPLPAFSDAQRGAAAPPGFRPAPMPLTPTAPGYPTSARATQPGEGHFFTSPRAQRKAKGHVASACVPCKRAHLR